MLEDAARRLSHWCSSCSQHMPGIQDVPYKISHGKMKVIWLNYSQCIQLLLIFMVLWWNMMTGYWYIKGTSSLQKLVGTPLLHGLRPRKSLFKRIQTCSSILTNVVNPIINNSHDWGWLECVGIPAGPCHKNGDDLGMFFFGGCTVHHNKLSQGTPYPLLKGPCLRSSPVPRSPAKDAWPDKLWG